MKKLGFLIAASFLLTACDSKPGGNKGILPLNQEGVEQVDQAAKTVEEAPQEESATETNTEAQTETADTQEPAADTNTETEN